MKRTTVNGCRRCVQSVKYATWLPHFDTVGSVLRSSRTSLRYFIFQNAHWLLFTVAYLAVCLPIYTNASVMSPNIDVVSSETGICQDLDIRNTVDQFDKLRNCQVVEGYVQILLIDQTEESAYDNISFPQLTEITDYLLLYRVNGLKSLSTLFPNLSVIRGQKTFFNYAFVVFEMSSLQDIGLYSLTNIENGLVRIDKNPSLCYVDTIDWDVIATEGKGEHFIKSNKLENECPICPGDDNEKGLTCPPAPRKNSVSVRQARHLCWNRQHCQKVCPEHCGSNSCNDRGECCSDLCLGGCSHNLEQCKVCKHLTKNGKCLRHCPAEQVMFLKRRCIFEHECYNMKRPVDNKLDMQEKPYKVFNESCLLHCPSNYYEKKENSRLVCVPCKGQCRKICNSAIVDSISSAQNLRGCTHIQGSLEIQIRGGRKIVKELEENLNMIEVIDGYLKIVRSFPLVSLNFLKNLREIRGETLENGKYVFIVLDNQNLQELWDWETTNHTLKILKGRLFFHFNPKLCLYKIQKLRDVAHLDNFTDLEVARNSNGDKVPCKVTQLNVTMSELTSVSVRLQWPQFQLDDSRSLLGYVVYIMEAPYQNVTLYDGRDACGGDGWRVDDVSSPNTDTVEHDLSNLKDYTQYAFYVRTYTIATEQYGAQSPIYYFRTLPGEPGVPQSMNIHSLSSSTIMIKWQPPAIPNGNITHYRVNVSCTRDVSNDRNYCIDPPLEPVDKKTIIIKQDETTLKSSNDTCPCASADKKKPHDKIENDRVSQINFENALHNRIYIKKSSYKQKREIDTRAAKERYTEKNPAYIASNYSGPTGETDDLSYVNGTKDDVCVGMKDGRCQSTNTSLIDTCTTKEYVVYGNTSLFITDLPYFTKYIITVQACREKASNLDKGNVCGPASILTTRTLSAEGVDLVTNVSLNVEVSNHTLGVVHVKWEEPQNPNGIILMYKIEYKRLDSLYFFQPVCITRQQFLQMKKKYVLKDLPAGNYSVRVMATSLAGPSNYSEEYYFFIEQVTVMNSTQAIVGIVVTISCLFVVLILAYYLRRRYLANVPSMKLIASVNPEYVSTVYVPDDWEVPRKNIELLHELGQGSFGMVYEGIARDIVKGKPEIRCAVKTVGENATDRERIEFLNEASVMKAFDTTHVVRLLGVVSQGQPSLVIMELMANGDLKSYLRSHRPDADINNLGTGRRQPPTLKRILQMAIEIADGMAYLAAKKFVHRDLAARNCMVAEDLTVKVGDFGMTRDIYETDYYRKGTKGLLPVRWMAPESLKDGVFTSNSDVWSYGVVLWEMTTLASQPYQGLSNDQVLRYVIDGGVMERPENCPDVLYHLMRICWQHKSCNRPSFLDLATSLLEDASPNFKNVSFYHSPAGIEARNAHAAAQDDPSTPLRITNDIEDFSLGSGSEQESEPENIVDSVTGNQYDGNHVNIKFSGDQENSYPSGTVHDDLDDMDDDEGKMLDIERQAPKPRLIRGNHSIESVRSGEASLKSTTHNGYANIARP